MNSPLHPSLRSPESSRRTPNNEPTAQGAISAPHGAVRSIQAPLAVPSVAPATERLSLLVRLRVATGLITGLRASDFHAASTFVRLKYAGQPFVIRWCRFTGWVLRQAFREIPEAMQCLTLNGRVSHTPAWLTDENPLANYPWAKNSQAALPAEVDTVVIGAGFTGGALAFHWSRRAPADRRLIVLEMDDPASGSSGRNEGQVVMGRYYMMVRDSVHKHLDKARSDLDSAQRLRLAEQFAGRYCHAAYHNAELIETTIRDEQFDCDYARSGWVQVREEAKQPALAESVRLAIESGYTDWTGL